jgi:hypothetical protein
MLPTRTRSQTQFVVLAPSKLAVSKVFRNLQPDTGRHQDLLAEVQRFRGRVYASDGAIQPDDLTEDGRHAPEVDSRSWHVLSLDPEGHVCACLRYVEEKLAKRFEDLWVRHAALARCPTLGRPFRKAVESEMERARNMRVRFGEVGGWAVAQDHRMTIEPLRIILATYGLLELLGGCAGVATATFRHHSSTILRKIGLSSLVADGAELPPYYDPQYRCQMEVLRFDSRCPNPKYRAWISELAEALSQAPVICRQNVRVARKSVFRGFELPIGKPVFMPGLVPTA